VATMAIQLVTVGVVIAITTTVRIVTTTTVPVCVCSSLFSLLEFKQIDYLFLFTQDKRLLNTLLVSLLKAGYFYLFEKAILNMVMI
jgi:hypothetical protein